MIMMERNQSDHQLLGHNSNQDPFYINCSVWSGGSWRVPIVSNFFL